MPRNLDHLALLKTNHI